MFPVHSGETISYSVNITRDMFAHDLNVVAQRHHGEKSHPALTPHVIEAVLV
jgi:hypothetical protein